MKQSHGDNHSTAHRLCSGLSLGHSGGQTSTGLRQREGTLITGSDWHRHGLWGRRIPHRDPIEASMASFACSSSPPLYVDGPSALCLGVRSTGPWATPGLCLRGGGGWIWHSLHAAQAM